MAKRFRHFFGDPATATVFPGTKYLKLAITYARPCL